MHYIDTKTLKKFKNNLSYEYLKILNIKKYNSTAH